MLEQFFCRSDKQTSLTLPVYANYLITWESLFHHYRLHNVSLPFTLETPQGCWNALQSLRPDTIVVEPTCTPLIANWESFFFIFGVSLFF